VSVVARAVIMTRRTASELLTEKQWRQIVECSGLPEAARPQIELAISVSRRIRAFDTKSLSGSRTRAQIKHLVRTSRALEKRLSRTMSNQTAVHVLTASLFPENRLAPYMEKQISVTNASFKQDLEHLVARVTRTEGTVSSA
jgi:hypothetical protein